MVVYVLPRTEMARIVAEHIFGTQMPHHDILDIEVGEKDFYADRYNSAASPTKEQQKKDYRTVIVRVRLPKT